MKSLDKIKLNPPIEGPIDISYPFEGGSLKDRMFRLLVANIALFELPADITHAILADACYSTPEETEAVLNELEWEFQTGDLVQ